MLLYEAAPKLNIAASAGGASHHAAKTPRRAAYSEEGGLRERLAAAVPMPTGALAPVLATLARCVTTFMPNQQAAAHPQALAR